MALPIDVAAREYPDELAFDDGSIRITYGELETKMAKSRVSHAAELKPGQHVAWCPGNDDEAFLNFWALLRRGCVACPISPRFPEATRCEIVERIDARWLPDLELEAVSLVHSDTHFKSDQPSTLILSSGSTGVPKAIVHSMQAHTSSAVGAATNIALSPGHRWLWSLPLCHVSGLSILVRCAVAGATVVGMKGEEKLTATLLDQKKVTHLSVVSIQLRRLLADDSFPSPYLETVLVGGSAVDADLVVAARARGIDVRTTYGLTEMASQVTTSQPLDDPSKSGRLLPGRLLKVCPSGEIIVRGEMLCLGYYESGSIKSVRDEDGWFYTRDIGEFDDSGQLSVRGRMDNMFISGGENIYPETIERAILSLFDVSQAVVVPRKDPQFGARPVAFVDGDLPLDWDVKLRQRLQGYEFPVEVLSWPSEVSNDIKPDREKLKKLSGEASG